MENAELAAMLDSFWRTDDGLTPVERAEAFGIDLSLIEESLRLTPEQRMDQNQAAIELIELLREGRG